MKAFDSGNHIDRAAAMKTQMAATNSHGYGLLVALEENAFIIR